MMMRSGMIKKLGAGIGMWMPLGVRVLRKVEQVVREEMNAAGAIELPDAGGSPPSCGRNRAAGKRWARR